MIDPADPNRIAVALVDYLRDTLRAPDLACVDQPQPIFGGNRTFVYGFRLRNAPEAYAGPLVLRVSRSPEDAQATSLEAGVQLALANLGYPTPSVLTWSTDGNHLGGPFQVMVRLPGKPLVLADPPEETTARGMLTQLLPELRRLLFGPWPGVLADVQVELHQLDIESFREELKAHGSSEDRLALTSHIKRLTDTVNRHSIEGLREGFRWLREHCPAGGDLSICHGDFFPNQVLVEDGRDAGVIDWGDAMIAPSELDVGIVKAGIETLPVPLGRAGATLQRWLAQKYVAAYENLRPLDFSRLQYGEAFRCGRTLLQIANRRMGMAGQIDVEPGPNPYDSAVGEERLVSRFYELTKTRASVPAPAPNKS